MKGENKMLSKEEVKLAVYRHFIDMQNPYLKTCFVDGIKEYYGTDSIKTETFKFCIVSVELAVTLVKHFDKMDVESYREVYFDDREDIEGYFNLKPYYPGKKFVEPDWFSVELFNEHIWFNRNFSRIEVDENYCLKKDKDESKVLVDYDILKQKIMLAANYIPLVSDKRLYSGENNFDKTVWQKSLAVLGSQNMDLYHKINEDNLMELFNYGIAPGVRLLYLVSKHDSIKCIMRDSVWSQKYLEFLMETMLVTVDESDYTRIVENLNLEGKNLGEVLGVSEAFLKAGDFFFKNISFNDLPQVVDHYNKAVKILGISTEEEFRMFFEMTGDSFRLANLGGLTYLIKTGYNFKELYTYLKKHNTGYASNLTDGLKYLFELVNRNELCNGIREVIYPESLHAEIGLSDKHFNRLTQEKRFKFYKKVKLKRQNLWCETEDYRIKVSRRIYNETDRCIMDSFCGTEVLVYCNLKTGINIELLLMGDVLYVQRRAIPSMDIVNLEAWADKHQLWMRREE